MPASIRLGDVATYINGYPFKPEDRGTTGLPIIRIQDLTGNAYDLGFYDGEYPSRIEINDGDVLISWSGSLGVYVWNRGKALLNQHIFRVVFDKATIDKDYFVFAVRHKLHEMESKTHGATMKHIVKGDFDSTMIPFPSLAHQVEIAQILSTVHDLMEARQRQLRTLDTLIKARFVELFGELKTNEHGYPVMQLGDLVTDIIAGWSANGESRIKKENEKAVLKVSAVTQGFFKPDEHKALADDLEIKKYVYPHKGDMLFSRANTRELVGATAIIEQDYPDLLLPDKLWRVLFSDTINVYYAKYALSMDSVRQEFSAQSTGTSGSMFNVSAEKFKSIRIPVPPIELQKQFAAFVSQVDKSKLSIQASLDQLETLKQSLMQKYFG